MNMASDNTDYEGETWLYPCPFCGGKAQYIEIKSLINYTQEYYIQCTKCQIETYGTFPSKALARKVWNRRVKI